MRKSIIAAITLCVPCVSIANNYATVSYVNGHVNSMNTRMNGIDSKVRANADNIAAMRDGQGATRAQIRQINNRIDAIEQSSNDTPAPGPVPVQPNNGTTTVDLSGVYSTLDSHHDRLVNHDVRIGLLEQQQESMMQDIDKLYKGVSMSSALAMAQVASVGTGEWIMSGAMTTYEGYESVAFTVATGLTDNVSATIGYSNTGRDLGSVSKGILGGSLSVRF